MAALTLAAAETPQGQETPRSQEPYAFEAPDPLRVAAAAPALPVAETPPAERILEAARRATVDGRFLLVQGRLDEAIEKLKVALSLWPGYGDAKELLGQAQAKRDEAQRYYDAAAALAKQGKFDEAVQQANAALGVYRMYKQARDLIQDINRRAEQTLLASGLALTAAGNLAEADAAFRRALDYAPESPASRDGLARVASLRSDAAAGRNQWGAALLWADEAADFAPKKQEYQAMEAAARAQVAGRIRVSLGPQPDGGMAPSAATSELRAAIWKRLAGTRPEFLVLQVEPGAAAPPTFSADVEVTSLEISPDRLRVENRSHRYNVQREEPNPDYATVSGLLATATDYLGRLRLDYNQTCPFCAGTGWLICRACGGTGFAPGPVPGAACPVCSAPGGRSGWGRCPRCWGSEHYSSVSITDVRRQEVEVQRLQNVLARTPQTVMRQYPADWPYTIEFHEKVGTLEAGLRIWSAAARRVVAADAVRKSRRFEDSTVQNANPAIGLTAKTLKMPDDETMRKALVADLAGDAAVRLVAAVANICAGERQAEYERLAGEGRMAEAIEAGVDAAVFKTGASRDDADRMMNALRARLRGGEKAAPAPPALPAPPAPPAQPAPAGAPI
jgi:tetratricopeptide (TPR) repeat protein